MGEPKQNWTDGYVAEIDYTHGFYKELSPQMLFTAALVKGVRAPDPNAQLTYCELGCGQGLSSNILAASMPHVEFHATDFNPNQITSARRLAADAGLTNIQFYDDSFEEYIKRESIPPSFDIISLHGIYSWISKRNREQIIDFIRTRLRPGGVVYISYNTFPGWSEIMPMRQVLIRHANSVGGPIETKIDAALAYAQQLVDEGSDYFKRNQNAVERLKKIVSMPRKYLAHEYFNEDLAPFYFEEIAQDMAAAKLSYVASTQLTDLIDAVNFSAEQISWLNKEPDLISREGSRDFLVNQQFRRDVFARGIEKYALSESRAAWLNQRFALVVRREDVPKSFTSRLGEMTLHESVYGPILERFAAGPATVHDVFQEPRIAELGWQKSLQAISLLTGLGHLHPCLSVRNEKKRKEATKAFNKALFQRAESSAEIAYLASPVLGSGVPVGRFEQLFLKSLSSGKKTPADWAFNTWEILKTQGQKLQKDGKAIEADTDNLAELTRQAEEFNDRRLSVLSTLQVI